MRRTPWLMLLALVLSAASSRAGAETVVVTQADCDALTAYEPSEDVTYQPGVDVDGNAIAPADLDDSGQLHLAKDREYWFDVSVPLNQAIDIDADSSLAPVGQSDIYVGSVSVKDGQVFFDGQPLGSEEAHALAEACRKMQEEAKEKP